MAEILPPRHAPANVPAKAVLESVPNPPVNTDSDQTNVAQDEEDSKPQAPPYWTAHQRTVSNVSYCSVHNKFKRAPIKLHDNTASTNPETENIVWAQYATIDSSTMITSAKNLGEWAPTSYVAYDITIETLDSGSIHISKRYSEFDELRQRLLLTFPLSEGAMPELPPKAVMSKFRPKFLEKRRDGLSHFLNWILLNPEFAGSRALKDWIFEA